MHTRSQQLGALTHRDTLSKDRYSPVQHQIFRGERLFQLVVKVLREGFQSMYHRNMQIYDSNNSLHLSPQRFLQSELRLPPLLENERVHVLPTVKMV